MRESRLAHQPLGHHASGQSHSDRIERLVEVGQRFWRVLAGIPAVLLDDLRDRMAAVESVRIGFEAEFDDGLKIFPSLKNQLILFVCHCRDSLSKNVRLKAAMVSNDRRFVSLDAMSKRLDVL
jgi:hypothetical protein